MGKEIVNSTASYPTDNEVGWTVAEGWVDLCTALQCQHVEQAPLSKATKSKYEEVPLIVVFEQRQFYVTGVTVKRPKPQQIS